MISLGLVCWLTAAAPHSLSIRFDYRFDGGFFSQHPDRKASLEAAARAWTDILSDDFPAVSALAAPRLLISDDGSTYRGNLSQTVSGRACQRWTTQQPHAHHNSPEERPNSGIGNHAFCRNPDHELRAWCYTTDPKVRWEYCDLPAGPAVNASSIDDLVVFVYAEPLGPSVKARGRPLLEIPDGLSTQEAELLRRRSKLAPFQPWAGEITVNSDPARPWFFDATPETVDDIPNSTQYDFITTASHELGHILGFFDSAKPFQEKLKNGWLAGVVHMDEGHIDATFREGLLRPNLENQLMGTHDPIQGFRQRPGRIEGFVLSQLGYHVNPAILQAASSSPYQDASPDRRQVPTAWELGGQGPRAFWAFDDAGHLNSAIRGTPVLFQPQTTGVLAQRAVSGGVRLQPGELLWAEHPISSGNCGGETVHCFSVVFDIRIPESGKKIPLFNANGENRNAADAWLDEAGHLGVDRTWSRESLSAGKWHRVVWVVSLNQGQQQYFADGKPVLVLPTPSTAERFSLDVKPPRFVLFGTAGETTGQGPIDVKRVVLYDRALTPGEVELLGRVEVP